MATHSSILAWRIPGTGEPGGLPSMRSHRVRHDWSDLAAAGILILFPGGSDSKVSAYNGGDLGLIPEPGRSPGEGNGNPLSVLPPAKSHGQRSLVGYSPWGHRVKHNWVTSLSLSGILIYLNIGCFPIIWVFFKQCFRVFRVEVFHLLDWILKYFILCLNFGGSIVGIQCCVSFRHIANWIS